MNTPIRDALFQDSPELYAKERGPGVEIEGEDDYECEFSELSMRIRYGGPHFRSARARKRKTRTSSRPRPPP